MSKLNAEQAKRKSDLDYYIRKLTQAIRGGSHEEADAWYGEVTGTMCLMMEEIEQPQVRTSKPDGHDYVPGEYRHPMHTDPLCSVCGESKRNHQ